MSEQTLFRIRSQERQFIAHEIDSWKLDHEAMRVHDLEDLIQVCLLDRDKDNSFIRFILGRSRKLGREELDEVNRLIRECCDDALATCPARHMPPRK